MAKRKPSAKKRVRPVASPEGRRALAEELEIVARELRTSTVSLTRDRLLGLARKLKEMDRETADDES